VTSSFWWDLLLGIVAALLLAWLALVIALVIVRPRGGLLREALRLLPDVLRLVRRLAADQALPREVRVRLGLLLAYLAVPIDLIPTSSRSWATPTTPSSSPPSCAVSSAAPGSTRSAHTGPARTTDSPRSPGSPVSTAPPVDDRLLLTPSSTRPRPEPPSPRGQSAPACVRLGGADQPWISQRPLSVAACLCVPRASDRRPDLPLPAGAPAVEYFPSRRSARQASFRRRPARAEPI
jgi:hypothetical protein